LSHSENSPAAGPVFLPHDVRRQSVKHWLRVSHGTLAKV
jgi:hypothetical protein